MSEPTAMSIHPPADRLPAAPLIARYGPTWAWHRQPHSARFGEYVASLEPLADRLGVASTTIEKWQRRGLRLNAAEDLAARLGFHPAEVWGDDYWRACGIGDR